MPVYELTDAQAAEHNRNVPGLLKARRETTETAPEVVSTAEAAPKKRGRAKKNASDTL